MDAKASERTAMELYFAPFRPWDPTSRLDAGCGALFFRLEVPARGAVSAGVGSFMCAYNKVTWTPWQSFFARWPRMSQLRWKMESDVFR